MYEEDFLNKVIKIAEVKYGLEKDVILGLEHHVKFCYEMNFTPRRTVEYLAKLIF